MATKAAVAHGTLPNGEVGLTVSLTVEGFGTPTAAIIFVADASNAENPRAGAGFSVGFLGGGAQRSLGIVRQDGMATMTGARHADNSRAFTIPATSSSLFMNGTASFITDGVQLSISTISPSRNTVAAALLIGGTTNVKVGTLTPAANTSEQDVTTIGFKPDLVFFLNPRQTTAGGYGLDSRINFGAAHNSASNVVSQACVSWASLSGVADGTTGAAVLSGRASGSIDDAMAIHYDVTVSSFDSSGFTFQFGVAATPPADDIYYMAIKLADPDDAWVGVVQPPVDNAGSVTQTDIGFKPDAVCFAATACETTGTVHRKGYLGFGLTSSQTQRTLYFWDQDAAATSECGTAYSDTTAVRVHSDNGTVEATGKLMGVHADGFTVNYDDAAAATRQVLAFAIGDSTSTAYAHPLLSNPGFAEVSPTSAKPKVDYNFD